MSEDQIVVTGVRPTPDELRPPPMIWPSVRKRRWLPEAILIAGVIVSTLVASGPEGSWLWSWVLVTGLITLRFWRWSMRSVHRAMSEAAFALPSNKVPTIWTLDATGLQLESPTFRGAYRWRAVVDVLDEGDRFVFVISPFLALSLPRSAMNDDQIAALNALLAHLRREHAFGGGVDYPPPPSDKA